jgi:hypothetical protein
MPSKRDIVLAALAQTSGDVKTTLALLSERGVTVDRSYVYEIRREVNGVSSGSSRTKVTP